MLSCYLAQPRNGHLVQALNIFKYLYQRKNNELYFYPAYNNAKDPALAQARTEVLKEIYPDAVEDLPPNSTPPQGNPVEVNCFIDSDHAGETVTRISQTGYLLYLNSTPIIYY